MNRWVVALVAALVTSGLLDSASGLPSALANESTPATAEATPSFRRDVMPILFRAGCNTGTCHGSARGKDGFMLSLFGYDPRGDYDRIVRELIGRRVNPAVPEQSLLLLKSIGAVPHTGGKLFTADSEYYRVLEAWIAAGAPDDVGEVPEVVAVELSTKLLAFERTGESQQLRVTATASDGTQRDVTSLARFLSNNESVARIDANGVVTATGPGDTSVFARFSRFTVGAETIVVPPDPGFVWSNPPQVNFIDELIDQRLKLLRIQPAELCDEETFLRRVTLDLAARPPTVEEYTAYFADTRPDRRAHKIDQLLASPDFTDYWTALWSEQLRVIGGNYAPDATPIKAAETFQQWIRGQLESGRPLDEFIAEMIDSSGSNLTNGPVNMYTMMVHKPNFDPKAFAADFSQVFLGVQMQCAECHNHPFDRWTMDDYYGFVSFFTGMRRKPGIEPRDRRIYWEPTAAPAAHLVDGRPMPPKAPGALKPVAAHGDPRSALAAWVTSADNELFRRNLANRVWAHLLGRGIVEPVDDVRATNPPVNEPLLDALGKRLAEWRFDLRSLVRDICNSRTYQASSEPNRSNVRDQRHFSHARLRRLRADVLLDSITQATGVPRRFNGFPLGARAIQFYPREIGDTEGAHFGDSFLETFGRSSRATICACETKREPTLSQTLHLAVGDTVRERLSTSAPLIALVQSQKPVDEIIAALYLRTLARQPTAEEQTALRTLVGEQTHDQAAYEDILWGLVNSTEFASNH